jgi:hypothetical protein
VLVSDATRSELGEHLIADGPIEAAGKGIGATLRLWEVLALRGETMRVLPTAVRKLVTLRSPLDAGVRLILGKQVDSQVHPARLRQLGAAGAELESDAPLAMFGALQVLLDSFVIDGKVVDLTGRVALVRFTGVDWDTQARIETFARAH